MNTGGSFGICHSPLRSYGRAPAPPFSGVRSRLKPAGLSDRETKSLEAEVEAHEKRIDEAVFALYGVDELPE